MKEIIFKAKRTDNNEWVEGYFMESDGKTYIISNDIKTEINKDTLCQYTNLNDEYDNKIFEGDIIKSYSWGMFLTHKIIYDYYSFMAISISNGNDHSIETSGNCRLYNLYKSSEGLLFIKVGNVFDNPELLKNK